MESTRNDLTRLIEFSLQKMSVDAAIKLFPMFTPRQISCVYEMTVGVRQRMLNGRVNHQVVPNYRTPAQLQRMAEIAIDPSNR